MDLPGASGKELFLLSFPSLVDGTPIGARKARGKYAQKEEVFIQPTEVVWCQCNLTELQTTPLKPGDVTQCSDGGGTRIPDLACRGEEGS